MKKRRGWVLVVAAVVVLAALAAGYSRMHGGPPPIDATRIVTVDQGPLVVSVVATGKVEPITKVEIKSKANGIIERLNVDVDDVVQPGQVLAELDRETLTARCREAEANLQAAEAAREGAIAQVHKSEIEAESPDVDLARRNYSRAQQLREQRIASELQVDEAKTTFEQAQNRQRAAAGQLVIARARVTEATAVVAQARAAVERANEDLASATIRSPMRATVLTRDVEKGSPVSSILNLGSNATLIMTLGDIEHVFVRGRVDESDIGRVKLGQIARITTESFRGKVFDGSVTQISPIGVDRDNVTTFQVKVSIDNPGHVLKANMTANAEIVIEQLPTSLLIPEAAVTYDQSRHAFVDRLDPASPTGARRVPITVGTGNGSRIQVLGGLAAGDRVVLPG
jgi:HlyD family secretion protein